MAHQGIIQTRDLVVQLHKLELCAFVLIYFQILVACDTIHVHGFHFYHKVHFAGFQGDGTAGAFRYDLPCHVLDSRFAAPIIFKGLELQAVAQIPCFEYIGSGADGVLVEVVAGVDQLFGHNGVGCACQVIQNNSTRAMGGDADGLIIDDIHLLDVFGAGLDQREVLRPIQRGFDVFYGHLLACMELDAFADLKIPLGLTDSLIRFRQARLRLHIHIAVQQAFVGEQVHVAAGYRVVFIGCERRRLTHGGDHNAVFRAGLAARTALLATSGNAGQQRGRNGKQCDHTHHALVPFFHDIHLFHLVWKTAKHPVRSKPLSSHSSGGRAAEICFFHYMHGWFSWQPHRTSNAHRKLLIINSF